VKARVEAEERETEFAIQFQLMWSIVKMPNWE
jgi:hypothetical protein